MQLSCDVMRYFLAITLITFLACAASERTAPTVNCAFFMYFCSCFFKCCVICFFIGAATSNNARMLLDIDNFRMNLAKRASFQFKFEAC